MRPKKIFSDWIGYVLDMNVNRLCFSEHHYLQTPSSHILTIQLLGKDDAVFDDLDVYTGRWQSYIQSFVTVSVAFNGLERILTFIFQG